MDDLKTYLKALTPQGRDDFARRCGTTYGYLRKAMSKQMQLGEGLCINIERESARAVICERLRPDTDWAYIRGTAPAPRQEQAATDSVANGGGDA